jgi:hypothetical protein
MRSPLARSGVRAGISVAAITRGVVSSQNAANAIATTASTAMSSLFMCERLRFQIRRN